MIQCPNCQAEVSSEHINIKTDLAKCTSCNTIFKVSESIVIDSVPDTFDIQSPPKGAWIRHENGQVILGASTKSAIAFFLVPFMLVWSGFSLGGIYGSQIIKGKFDLMMSLFGIPFLAGSIFFWGLTLLLIFGKVEFTIDKNHIQTFIGIGSIGRRRVILWENISSIQEIIVRGSKGRTNTLIQIEGSKRVKLGYGLNSERRYYLIQALKQMMTRVKSSDYLNKSIL